MNKTLTLLALALVGCAATPPAAPVVYIQDPGGDPGLRAEYLDAASGWSPLGFEFTFDDPGMPECDGWKMGQDPNCEVTAWLFRVPGLVAEGGTQALTDPSTRTISIDVTLTGDALDRATAHELGHVILHTPRHTQGGIMGGASDRMWDVDRQLACETIGDCLINP